MMMRLVWNTLLVGSLIFVGSAARLCAQDLPQSLPAVTETSFLEHVGSRPETTNPVLWQQYQALQAGHAPGGCQSCGSGNKRCGCQDQLFPWSGGSGNCDNWCVGPKWEVQASGLILHRENAELGRVIAAIGGTTSLVDQFDHGVGGRLFVTGYNDSGFGLQVGWEGIDSWSANTTFAPVGTTTRTFEYDSRLNSVEINFLPHVPYAWKLYTGFRYVELGENFSDAQIVDKPIPAPISAPATPIAYQDTTVSHLLKNRLIGFQVGGRRDAWQFGSRLTFESFINAGVYCNKFRRDDVTRNDTTIITGDDIDTTDNEFSQTTTSVQGRVRTSPTDIAFLGEAGINSVLKINECVALRAGYQVMVIDGVGQGLDAYFASGLNGSTLLYHGLQFGFEYRR